MTGRESSSQDGLESGRRFRACRTCKRQKVKCEGQEHIPCRRCKSAGVECVFDLISDKRREATVGESGVQEIQRIEFLENEIRRLRGTTDSLTNYRSTQKPRYSEMLTRDEPKSPIQLTSSFQAQHSSNSNQSVGKGVTQTDKQSGAIATLDSATFPGVSHSIPTDGAVEIQQTNNESEGTSPCIGKKKPSTHIPQPRIGDITRDDLCAPVSAVAEMTATTEATVGDPTNNIADDQDFLSRLQQDTPDSQGPAKRRRISNASSFTEKKHDDLVSRGNLTDSKGRELFNLFFSGCVEFHPLLDPILDGFDSLRARSKFCFTTVLFIAARIYVVQSGTGHQLRTVCEREARLLAADSLFQRSQPIESIQAMVLMAAYTKNSWLAIGHAVRMAKQIRLDQSLSQLLARSDEVAAGSDGMQRNSGRKNTLRLAREARVWLILFHIEQEIAFGLSQPSLLEEADIADARSFLELDFSVPSDARFVSIVEVVTMRGRFHRAITATVSLPQTASSMIASMSHELDEWLSTWDFILEDRGYHETSFQRTSLQMQRNYAEIFICCAILGKLEEQGSGSENFRFVTAEMNQVLGRTAIYIEKQLRFVVASASYKWSFQWAPIYSALALAFVTVLGLKISHLRPTVIDRTSFLPLAIQVAELLEGYPSTCYYRLVQLMVSLPEPKHHYPAGPDQAHGNSTVRTANHPLDATISSFKSIWGRSPTSLVSSVRQGSALASHKPDIAGSPPQQAPVGNQIPSDVFSAYTPPSSLAPLTEEVQSPYQYEIPSWMLDWSSIESMGQPEHGHASIFDFDMALASSSIAAPKEPLYDSWE